MEKSQKGGRGGSTGGWQTAVSLGAGGGRGAVEQHDGGVSQWGSAIKAEIFVEAQEGLGTAAGDGALGFSFLRALAEDAEISAAAIGAGLREGAVDGVVRDAG